MVYCQIQNFPKFKLSMLSSIFLVGCINSLNLDDQSYDKILMTVFEMISKLRQDSSQPFEVNLLFFAGDTPAMQSMGGFIESVGSANYPCRECKTSKAEIRSILNENQCQRRNRKETIETAKKIVNKQSIEGVKRYSSLWRYDFFNPIEMTPQDPMHVILEGIGRKIIMYYFSIWIGTKRTDIDELNSRINTFKYGHLHMKNKLKPMRESDLDKNELVITASQMKTLLLLFPFIFFDIVDTKSQDYK